VDASLHAFVTDLTTWCRTGDDSFLVRVLRSRCAAVPHDIAAAYAAIAQRAGPLLDAIARERLALPADERDAVFTFSDRVRDVRDRAERLDDAALAALIVQTFDAPANAQTPAENEEPLLQTRFAPAAEAERGEGVRARQSHFSASALNAYAECARKWYYRYVCAAVEDPGSSASTYGTAFHAALEDFHAEFAHPDESNERAMRKKIEGYVNWAFERYRNDFATAVEVELHKRRAQRTAQRYVDWLVAESKRAPFTVVGREVSADLDLDGHAFVGYIDRVDRDDETGAITIVDYKTGTIATSAAEYREKVRRFRDFQLPFYYWARTAAGDRVSRLALIPLKDALLDVTPVALEVVPISVAPGRRDDAPSGTISIADLERARTRMVEICAELTSGELRTFPVSDDPSACTYCAYQVACIDRPHAEREKFGR
jgi:RecB family exonuclease